MKSSVYAPKSHWILKNPTDSLTGIEHLLQEFPDARIVLTHRDMIAVAKSNYPLMKAVFGLYGYITSDHVIDFFLAWMGKATDEMIQIDKKYGEQVYNMHYSDVRRDPIETAKALYAHFQLEFTDQFLENMERYIAQESHASWKNPTRSDLFGDLHTRYKRYYEHFDITF